ncbi:triose-phosphate isomerase [soil metagenome]
MRPVIVAANWKMNTLPSEAGSLARAIAAATAEPDVIRVICPPSISLGLVAEALAGTGVDVGAQDVHVERSGPYTGEVYAAMAAEHASWSIVGHSERRRDHGATDAQVGRKLVRCGEGGLRAILCVGELLEQREAGTAVDTVRAQLRGALGEVLRDVSTLPHDVVIAYEPVWAIGTGRTARGADAAEMATAIRETVVELGGHALADALPVLYGGSVTSAAIDEFLAQPGIDGALVGGASLKVDEMRGIVDRAAAAVHARRGAVTET